MIKEQTLRLFRAFLYSLDGLKAAFLSEPAFILELILTTVITPIVCLLPTTLIAKALVISSLILVLVVELMNSSIEAIVDRISLERHPLSKKAKDIGSAAVFLSLINFFVIFSCVLYQATK